MADINNFTEISENFNTIKTLLNSIRAQGILNTSDVDKLLAGINSKLEKLNTEEDIDLIKIFLTDLKQNLDERHSVLLSKFGAIESLFSNLLKNSSETLKSSEVKELFDIVATNLSVFSREVVSQKEVLSDITLRLDAMRSDDSQKKEIVKNITFLKNDIERLTNGFDSIVLNLNENFKSVINTISSIDPSENITKFGKELEDVVNSSNTILSALQVLDKKNLQIEDAIKGLATQDDLISTKKWISDLASQEQMLAQSIDNLADRYYKIDNLADKIDASVEIIAGLKTIITDKDEQSASAIIDKLSQLEAAVKEISTNKAFEEFKYSMESALNNIYSKSESIQSAFSNATDEIQKINESIKALDINVNFKSMAADLNKSEQNIRDHVSVETDKIIQLVDVNATRTLNELSANADNLGEKLTKAQSLISTLCEKSFAEMEESISGLKTVVSQIDENNVSANNAIFSNITDRLAIFESSLKSSLEKQEDYVANSSGQIFEQIKNIKELSSVLDYKLDSSVIEINNAKVEFDSLKKSIDGVLALDFAEKVSDLKVDLFAAKEELANAFDTTTNEFSEKFANDLFGKYELLISKLDSVEEVLKQAQTDALGNLKAVLDNISSSIVDILSYVSITPDFNTDSLETKLDNITKVVSDNNLSYIENIRDIIDVVRSQVDSNIKSLQEDTCKQVKSINSLVEINSEAIREDIKNSYDKLIEVKEYFSDLNNTLKLNNSSVNETIGNVITTATALKDEFDSKLLALKNAILDKVGDFQKEFTCENADKISEIKFASETMHTKSMQASMEIKDELKGEIAQLIGTLKLNIQELTEQLAGTSIKLENANHDIVDCVKNDFSEKIDSTIQVFNSNLQDFSDGIEVKVEDVIAKFGELEITVNNLSNTTTTALTSTLAKVLDNFVSLKALLGNLNDKTSVDLQKTADIIINDFEKLRDKIDIVDANIDEDLTRQASILETNFEDLQKNLGIFFNQTNAALGNTIHIGLQNVSAAVRDTVLNNLEQYKTQIEELFNTISSRNDDQAKLLEVKVVELNSIIQQTMSEQNTKSAETLRNITENLKALLDENIEVTSADYNSLKDSLSNFAKSLEAQQGATSEYIKNKLGDIAKFIDSGLNVQAQAISEKFNDITLEVSEIASAASTLNNEITGRVGKISGEILNLKSELAGILGENSNLITSKLDAINEALHDEAGKLYGVVANSANIVKTELAEAVTEKSSQLDGKLEIINEGLTKESNKIHSLIKNSVEAIKADIDHSLEDNSGLVLNKLDNLLDKLQNDVENLQVSYAQTTDDVKNSINEKLSIELQSASGVISAEVLELKERFESFSDEQQKSLMSQIVNIINEVRNFSKDIEDKTLHLQQTFSKNLSNELNSLYSNINTLVEDNALKLATRYDDNISKYIDDLNIKSLEFKASFESLNERLDKDEISRMNVFQSQLKELSNSFNVLIEESKNVTKSEISSISETLIKTNRDAMQEVEQSIEDKVNSILVTNADIAAGELQSMEVFANKILDQVNINKNSIDTLRDFLSGIIKNEIEIVSENIEKETDVLIKDLLEQMSLMRDFQKDEISKWTTQLEGSVQDYIYNNINDLKSYIDIKSDTSILNSKLDNITTELSKSAEDIMAASSRLLETSVFENTISDMKTTNSVLISTMAEKLNTQIQDFVKTNISQDIDNKFNLFDKKFVDIVVDKYEEIKLISTKYNNAFDSIQASVKDLLGRFNDSKEEIYRTLLSVLNGINGEIDELNLSFADLKAHILNKSFDEAFQESINNQINGIQEIINNQLGYLEDISELCCDNLPELTEMSALVKYNIVQSLSSVNEKLDNQASSVQKELVTLKTDIITQFLNIFNQISFVAEQEEILDFIQEKHSELITILSHIVTTTNDVVEVKDNLAVVDNKVNLIKDDIDSLNEKILSIISSDGDIDYVYSLQDLESDIANLRLTLNELKENNKSKELEDLITSTNNIYSLVDSIKSELPRFDSEEFRRDFDSLNEDIVSISTRTNKLILASDESYKTLQENLQDFKLVINDLDERTRNFAHEAGIDRIDNKLGVINSMIQNGAKTNQVFNQVFEYLAEWVDNAGAQITAISDKVESLDDIGQIKVMLEDLKAEAEDNSDSVELIEALGNVFDKQAKKIGSLEAKLDRVIVETTISNKNNKIDMAPLEDTLNRFLVAIDDRMQSQQAKINSLESKLEDVMSMINPKDTAQLTKKVGGMDRQIAKLNKSIEKIASHVVEK